MHNKFWLDNMKRRDHFEDLGLVWRILMKWLLKTAYSGRVQIGFILHYTLPIVCWDLRYTLRRHRQGPFVE
jgi:hypothetical protein